MDIIEIRNRNGDLQRLICKICKESTDKSLNSKSQLLVPTNSATWNRHGDKIETNIKIFKEEHKNCNERNS